MSATRFETSSLTTLHWVGIGLAAITGLIHLALGITSPNLLFVLAGLGFFGAIVLLVLDFRRRLLYLTGIGYTGIQVVLYFVFNWPDVLSPVGIGDKVVQVALIAVLVVLYRRESVVEEVNPGSDSL